MWLVAIINIHSCRLARGYQREIGPFSDYSATLASPSSELIIGYAKHDNLKQTTSSEPLIGKSLWIGNYYCILIKYLLICKIIINLQHNRSTHGGLLSVKNAPM